MSTTIDYSTPGVDRVLSRLVEREVVRNCGPLVQHFLDHPEALDWSDYSFDDLYAIASGPDWESTWDNGTHEIHVCADGRRFLIDTLDKPDRLDDGETWDDWAAENGAALGEDVEADDWEELCHAAGLDDEPETTEALEFWIVSEWLRDQLAAQGELTGALFDLPIWGRTCSGQAISADGVILRIAHELGILPGQPNSWAD